jgi:hypothetical protein
VRQPFPFGLSLSKPSNPIVLSLSKGKLDANGSFSDRPEPVEGQAQGERGFL